MPPKKPGPKARPEAGGSQGQSPPPCYAESAALADAGAYGAVGSGFLPGGPGPQPADAAGASSGEGGYPTGQGGGGAGASSGKGGPGRGVDSKANKNRKKRDKRKEEKRKASERNQSAEDVEEDEDRQHFAEVCYSLMAYGDDAAGELRIVEEAMQALDPLDRALLPPQTQGRELFDEMSRCVAANTKFLKMLVETDEDAMYYANIPSTHQVQERNAVKVRTVLRQFVRDWADEGIAERESQYGPLLSALERFVPVSAASRAGRGPLPRVACPGSGLSRLPFEAARRGYSAQGNEFSYHMLQGSKWVLNETEAVKTNTIYPFVLSLAHRGKARDHVRGVQIPDVCPSEVLCPGGVMAVGQEFSMCAGEFVEVYQDQKAEWEAVLTCFFVDTAKNVFLYIRTIANMVRPGGLWSNIGPLLYHYAEQPDAISIELSWEEVKPAIARYFDFKEEEVREAKYTTNESGLFHTRYRCIYFAAIRNGVPAEGYSNPVF